MSYVVDLPSECVFSEYWVSSSNYSTHRGQVAAWAVEAFRKKIAADSSIDPEGTLRGVAYFQDETGRRWRKMTSRGMGCGFSQEEFEEVPLPEPVVEYGIKFVGWANPRAVDLSGYDEHAYLRGFGSERFASASEAERFILLFSEGADSEGVSAIFGVVGV